MAGFMCKECGIYPSVFSLFELCSDCIEKRLVQLTGGAAAGAPPPPPPSQGYTAPFPYRTPPQPAANPASMTAAVETVRLWSCHHCERAYPEGEDYCPRCRRDREWICRRCGCFNSMKQRPDSCGVCWTTKPKEDRQ